MNYKLSMMIQKYMREAPELTDESGVVVYMHPAARIIQSEERAGYHPNR